MWMIVAFLIALPYASATQTKAKDECQAILTELEKIETGRLRSNTFVAMLEVTVKEMVDDELDASLRDRLNDPTLQNFIAAGRGNFETLPVGFRILWLDILAEYQRSRDEGDFWSVPHFWRTPQHWYEQAPGVFPENHRRLDDQESLTQVLAPLDVKLWAVLDKRRDIITNLRLYAIPRKFDRAVKRRERKITANARFSLELRDAEDVVLKRFEIMGRGANAFDEEVQSHPPEHVSWQDWDTFGEEKESGSELLVYQNHRSNFDEADVGAWARWIVRSVRRQKLKIN